MRRLVLLSLAMAALAAPVTTRAQLSLGARIGYAKPTGQVVGGIASANESDFISQQVPVQIDLVYRLFLGFEVGVYGSYGFSHGGVTGSTFCPSGVSCQTTNVYRAGGQVAYTLPTPLLKPWVGVGAGYEWATLARVGTTNFGARGPEKVNFQVGVDLALPHLRVGPFVTLTEGDYAITSSPTSGVISSSVPSTANHSWLYYGLRFRVDP